MHNTTLESGHWIDIRLRQPSGNTNALGAYVRVRIGDRVMMMQACAEGSNLSQSPSTLHFGLGAAEQVDSITIRWPDASEERHESVQVDQRIEFNKPE
ncbi:MAG: ASPIC/UnbV domain-containing protein [Aureliella sp.]